MPFVDVGTKSSAPVPKPATVKESIPAVMVAAFAGEHTELIGGSALVSLTPFHHTCFFPFLSFRRFALWVGYWYC